MQSDPVWECEQITDRQNPGNKFVGVCARIRGSSESLVRRLVSFKILALTVLTFIGSQVARKSKEAEVVRMTYPSANVWRVPRWLTLRDEDQSALKNA